MVTLDSVGAPKLRRERDARRRHRRHRFFGRSQGPMRLFDVSFKLDEVPTALRPGLTAQVTIAGEPLKNVLYVPRQAIFDQAASRWST